MATAYSTDNNLYLDKMSNLIVEDTYDVPVDSISLLHVHSQILITSGTRQPVY